MSNLKNKGLFTAVFERYERNTESVKQKTHFRNVRTKDGLIVSRKLVFNEDTSSKIVGYLTIGEYVAFLADIADIEFKNIEFQYPHSCKTIVKQ